MAINTIQKITKDKPNELIISIPNKEVDNLVIVYGGLETQSKYERDELIGYIQESDLGKTTLNNSYLVIAYGGKSTLNYTPYNTIIDGLKQKIGTTNFNKIKNYYLIGFSRGGQPVFDVVDERNDWVEVVLIDADCSKFVNTTNKFTSRWTNVCGNWSSGVPYGCSAIEQQLVNNGGDQINVKNLDHTTCFKNTFSEYFSIKNVTARSNNTYGDIQRLKVYLYLAWQQGDTGINEHLKVANGKLRSYSSVTFDAIRQNWPGSYPEGKNAALSNYSSNPQVTAKLFLDTWLNFYSDKRRESLSALRNNGSNRTGVSYKSIQNIFSLNQVRGTVIDTDFLVTLGWIENGFNTDTAPNSLYQTMFQMNKDYFKDIINKINTKNTNPNNGYIDYPNLNEYLPQVVEKLKKKLDLLQRNIT